MVDATLLEAEAPKGSREIPDVPRQPCYSLLMTDEVKRSRRAGVTRLSAKNQVTIPVSVLAETGIRAGDDLRVEAAGPGRIALVRARDPLEELFGALGRDVYPDDYLEELRGEWG